MHEALPGAEAGVTDGASAYWYNMFGLAFRSEFVLPEASGPNEPPAETGQVVEIRRGSVPSNLDGGSRLTDWMEVGNDRCLYSFEDVCRMEVASGRTIVVDQLADAPDSDVRAFIFGSGIGTIAHQRSLVPLHISAVQTPIGSIAFTGPSGAGKSTIVAALAKFNGWPVICDDMALLNPSEKGLFLHVGVRRKKLWRDAIEALELGDRKMERDVSRLDKFHLRLEHDIGAQAGPIRRLYELSWGDACCIREVSPARRFALVMNSVYRPYLTPIFGDLSTVRRLAIAVSRDASGFVLERPRSLGGLKAVATLLAEHCRDGSTHGARC